MIQQSPMLPKDDDVSSQTSSASSQTGASKMPPQETVQSQADWPLPPEDESQDSASEEAAPQTKSAAEQMVDRGRAFVNDAASGESAQYARSVLSGAGSDAARVLGAVAVNPVANLPDARDALSEKGALGASVIFVAVSVGCVAVGVHLALGSVLGFMYNLSFGTAVQLLLASVVSFAALATTCFAARALFGKGGSYADDVFLAATAFLPISVDVLFIGLMGINNYLLATAMSVFALSYVVLILHTGFLRLAEVPEGVAAPLVPTALILSVWLSQLLFGTVA